MLHGIYTSDTKIYFGNTYYENLAAEIRKYGSNVLLVRGGNSYIDCGAKAIVDNTLVNSEINLIELSGIKADPVAEKVYEGIELFRTSRVDFILAVGGGSVIDTAKAIAIGAVDHDGDFFDFFTRARNPRCSAPVGVVLTVAGAGSESSDGAVITKGAMKYACGAPFMRPKFAIVDVSLMATISDRQLRYGIADALSHILERYFSSTPQATTSAYLCTSLLKAIIELSRTVVERPADLKIREDLVWAQKLAHDDTIGFGRKGDWATHTMAHEIGVLTNRPHGEILSIIFPAWMRYMSIKHQNLFNFLARELLIDRINEQAAAGKCVDFLEKTFSYLCPENRSLRQLGVSEADINLIAQRCALTTQSGTIGNLERLGQEEIKSILGSCI